jgi:hypothetical protein
LGVGEVSALCIQEIECVVVLGGGGDEGTGNDGRHQKSCYYLVTKHAEPKCAVMLVIVPQEGKMRDHKDF